MNWKTLMPILFFLSVGGVIWKYDTLRKENEFRDLRTKSLVAESRGVVTKITNMRKSSTKLCIYSFYVNDEYIIGQYQLNREISGVQVGSPVKVVYLLEDPTKSRLVWTEEDLDWIE